MPVIKVNDQQYSLRPGQTRLGSGSDVDVRLNADPSLGVQAIVDVAGGGDAASYSNGHKPSTAQAVIRRASDAASVRINGVALGVEPVPLIHGDKVEIAGQELLYADETKTGATELVAAREIDPTAGPREGAGTASTGGRLVSLVDGKEYSIPAAGLTIGRDAGADVVVAQNSVSRMHAEIVPVPRGYEVRDRSTNGMLVNGARVAKAQLLGRSDVIRIGTEEFRFYADALPIAVPSITPDEVPQSRTDWSGSLGLRRPVLAVLEVAAGAANGPLHEVTSPMIHIGRGPHNDVVIGDVSVSDAHAKLQLRNDGWYVVDLGTTNGTHVNGARVAGERKLHGSPVIRFGSVTAIFRPRDAMAEVRKGGHVIAGAERAQLQNTLATVIPPGTAAAAARVPAPPPEQPRIRAWMWISAILAVVVAVAYFVLNP